MQKVKTSWSRCPQCSVIISDRFIKRHEKDHHNPKVSESFGAAGSDSLNTSLSRSSLSQPGEASEYGYIQNSSLYAVVTNCKIESEPHIPAPLRDRIAFLSIGTMRVGKMAIGEPIIINNRYSYIAWPNASVPDCHVYLSPQSKVKHSSQSGLTVGNLCLIQKPKGVIPAACLKCCLSDSQNLPSNIDKEDLSSFIKLQLNMRIVSSGSDLELSYFGKPVNIHILEATVQGYTSSVSESLSQDMSNLNLSAYEPVTGTAAGGDHSNITSTPVSKSTRSRKSVSSASLLLADGLCECSTQFYQVMQTTTVTLSDQSPVPQLETGDEQEETQAIAGVDDLLDTLNQLIIEPITKKNTYQKYGVQVPKGALLHGPSGCGKTLIAKEVGRRLKGHAEFVVLDSAQLWSKQFGETENRLQKIFQQAVEQSPAVVFIDDIDVMCPRRERSQSDLEKRVLSSLVMEIDRATQNPNCYVFVLATTNRLDAVDMSLRRPGRIDREIEVPVPSSKQRKLIITAMMKQMLHNLSGDQLSDIAADCHGYVGADLQNLCREAGLNAMTQGSPDGVELSHFHHAMSTVQPSAMREIYIDVPKVRWTDIGGQADLKQKLIQAIVWPLQHQDKFKRLGIKPPRGVLMYGPPGCSKTMIAKALATETSLNFISIKGPELFSKWVGESEKAVREVFRKARSAAPSIVFFDEIDAVAVERGRQQSSGGGVGDRVLAQLLTELDGVEGLNNVNIVAATNRPDMIDKALMRPGRLDRLVYVPLPDENTRKEIFDLRLGSVPLSDDVNIGELVKLTHRYSGAEVTAVCNEAALSAMQEDITTEQLQQRHFISAIDTIKPQTTETMVKYYTDYASATNR